MLQIGLLLFLLYFCRYRLHAAERDIALPFRAISTTMRPKIVVGVLFFVLSGVTSERHSDPKLLVPQLERLGQPSVPLTPWDAAIANRRDPAAHPLRDLISREALRKVEALSNVGTRAAAEMAAEMAAAESAVAAAEKAAMEKAKAAAKKAVAEYKASAEKEAVESGTAEKAKVTPEEAVPDKAAAVLSPPLWKLMGWGIKAKAEKAAAEKAAAEKAACLQPPSSPDGQADPQGVISSPNGGKKSGLAREHDGCTSAWRAAEATTRTQLLQLLQAADEAASPAS